MGPARHNASSLLSPEGFFLGKMGFREALAAGDVALPQVRRRGCRGILILIFKSQPRGYHGSRWVKSGCWVYSLVQRLEQSHRGTRRSS